MWTCLSQLSEDKTCVLKIQLEKIPIYKRIRTIWFPILWGNCTYCTVSSLRVTMKHKVRIKRGIMLPHPYYFPHSSVQFSSVTQSCPTLCNPMNCSTPGLPVHHQLPEFTQTHVHWVSDAIQPSHLLFSPSPPALNLSQHMGLFQWVSSSHQVDKVLEF